MFALRELLSSSAPGSAPPGMPTVRGLPALVSINLSETQFSMENLSPNAVIGMRALTRLDLSCNPITLADLADFLAVLSATTSQGDQCALRMLSLSHIPACSNSPLVDLGQFVRITVSLAELLSLALQRLQIDGWRDVGEHLSKCLSASLYSSKTRLQSLSWVSDAVDNKGVVRLFSSLSSNRTLARLYLKCRFDDDALFSLVAALNQNSTLRMLHLEECNLSHEQCESLQSQIKDVRCVFV